MLCLPSIPRWFTLLSLQVGLSCAKFQKVFPGYATERLLDCTANLTKAEYTARNSCRQIFACILNNANNYDQAILSSGTSVLGFIPTLVTLLGSTNEELILLHTRFPVLALLLSISNINVGNINTIDERLRDATDLDTDDGRSAGIRSTIHFLCKSTEDNGGHHGAVQATANTVKAQPPILALVALYAIAIAGAALVIWQTIELGQKAVLTWACWTDFYPGLWLFVAVLQHIVSVATMRLALHDASAVGDDDVPMVPVSPSASRLAPADSFPAIPIAPRRHSTIKRRSTILSIRGVEKHGGPIGSGVWRLNLLSQDLNLELARPKLAVWSKVGTDLLANANFVYGTIIFSSLSLVSGVNAIKIVLVYGFVVAITRVLTAFVLENIVGKEDWNREVGRMRWLTFWMI